MDANDDERGYWQQRAEQEVELAQQATDPAAVAAHYQLSELCLQRVEAVKSTETDPDRPALAARE